MIKMKQENYLQINMLHMINKEIKYFNNLFKKFY